MEEIEKQEIEGLTLIRTCLACPEQYEVFTKDGKQIGYLRLRNGDFLVEYPDAGGQVIYRANPKGDGVFEEDERDYYLKEAVQAIKRKMKESL